MMNNLFLFQLNDSNFPIGSFSHSYGFETYMQNNQIHDQETFEIWLAQFMENQIISSDGLAVRYAYEALAQNQLPKLLRLTEMLNAQLIPQEILLANRKMGTQFLKIGGALSDSYQLAEYFNLTKAEKIAPHPAVVYTILAFVNGAEKETTISAYLLNMVTTLVQNAVRGVPLGQVAGQKIIFAYQEKIQDWKEKILVMKANQFGAVAPGIEIAQMQHEFLFARNFMS